MDHGGLHPQMQDNGGADARNTRAKASVSDVSMDMPSTATDGRKRQMGRAHDGGSATNMIPKIGGHEGAVPPTNSAAVMQLDLQHKTKNTPQYTKKGVLASLGGWVGDSNILANNSKANGGRQGIRMMAANVGGKIKEGRAPLRSHAVAAMMDEVDAAVLLETHVQHSTARAAAREFNEHTAGKLRLYNACPGEAATRQPGYNKQSATAMVIAVSTNHTKPVARTCGRQITTTLQRDGVRVHVTGVCGVSAPNANTHEAEMQTAVNIGRTMQELAGEPHLLVIDNAYADRPLVKTIKQQGHVEIVAAQGHKSAMEHPTYQNGELSTRIDVAHASTALWNTCEVTAMISRRPGNLLSKTHCTTIVDIRPCKRLQLNSNPVWKGANVSTPVAMRARTPEQQQA